MAGVEVWDVNQTLDFSSGDFSIDELHRQLDENGVAVLSNVLSPDDCDTGITKFHAWLAKFGTGFPDNVGTILHKYHAGHLETAWDVRLKVKAVFAALWNTQKLLTSFDGVSIGRPPEGGATSFNKSENKTANDLHHDQGPHRKGLHAYQGAVYLEEALEDDWCFAVMEKSNQFFEEFFSGFPCNRHIGEFRKINATERAWLIEKGCPIVKVPVPKGGMVLWDSRTVHAGAPPVHPRTNPYRWRYVCFISMAPAIWASKEDMAKKKEAYTRLNTTRHWPSNGNSAFKEYAPTPFDVTELSPAAQSTEARLLAGDLPYDFGDGESNGPGWFPAKA